jgi:hypothetical protein
VKCKTKEGQHDEGRRDKKMYNIYRRRGNDSGGKKEGEKNGVTREGTGGINAE